MPTPTPSVSFSGCPLAWELSPNPLILSLTHVGWPYSFRLESEPMPTPIPSVSFSRLPTSSGVKVPSRVKSSPIICDSPVSPILLPSPLSSPVLCPHPSPLPLSVTLEMASLNPLKVKTCADSNPIGSVLQASRLVEVTVTLAVLSRDVGYIMY
jgi:hypothetical protein